MPASTVPAADTAAPPEDRRDALFRHASHVFAARGYAGTKIADIATAAGISQGLLYRYFASKEALFTALIAASFAQLVGAATALEQMDMPARDKIAMALAQILANMEAEASFSERVLLIAQASIAEGVPEATKAVIRAESGKPYASVARIMARGQAEGGILPGAPEELATLFWTTIKGLALHKVSLGAAFRAPEVAVVGRLFLRPAATS